MTQCLTLVLGLGKTGHSVVRWLHARGEAVIAADSRRNPPSLADVVALIGAERCHAGSLSATLLAGVSRVVLSPGISRQEPIIVAALEAGIEVAGDVELFGAQAQSPVIAITGTNGKSTVTTLVARMLEAAGYSVRAGGNLGTPALDLLGPSEPDFYVLELSSYQLESTGHLSLAAATVLNVSDDHMDRYTGIASYAAAKARIFEQAKVAVLNADDALVMAMPTGTAKVVTFGTLSENADYTLHAGNLCAKGVDVMACRDVRLPGLHNAANALAAMALVAAVGVGHEAVVSVLKEFAGLPHRMQWVATHDGVRYVDDSKGTNVGATVAAVIGLTEPLVVVAGGDGKGQDFSPLARAFRDRARGVVLIGRDREAIAAVLADVCPVEFAADMTTAVAAAARLAQSGDIVLLSPACASLDMFTDYADRGRQFAMAAQGLNS